MGNTHSSGDELYKKAASGVAFNFFSTGFVVILQFFVTLVLVRMLSVPDYGWYNILMAVVGFAMIPGGIVIPVITRYLQEFAAHRHFYLAKRLFWYSFAYAFVVGVLVALFFAAFPAAFDAAFAGAAFDSGYALFFGVIVLLSLLAAVLDWTLVSMLEQRVRNAARLAYTAAILVFAYLFLSAGLGFWGVLFALTIAFALLVLVTFSMAYVLLLRQKDEGGPRHFERRRMARYAVFGHLGLVGEVLFMQLNVDLFLVGAFLGVNITALYAFASRVPQILVVNSPAALGAVVLFPFLVRAYTKSKDRAVLSNFFGLYTRFTGFFTFPLVLFTMAAALPIISLVFNPAYASTLFVFWLSALVSVVLAFRLPVYNVYGVLERPEIGWYAKLVFIPTTAINILLLLSGQGFFWVFFVTGIGILLMALVEYFWTRRFVALPVPAGALLRMLFNALVATVPLVALHPITHWVPFLAGLAASLLLYAGLSRVNRPFSRDDAQVFAKTGFLGRVMRVFCAGVR